MTSIKKITCTSSTSSISWEREIIRELVTNRRKLDMRAGGRSARYPTMEVHIVPPGNTKLAKSLLSEATLLAGGTYGRFF
jgi:hypothetical protein